MRQVRASPEGAAGFSTRACAVPSTSPSSTAREAALRPARGEGGAERLEHAGEQERERLEAVHRPVQLERRLEALGERRGDEEALVLAAGEADEARAVGAEALGEGDGRQAREVADRAQAPAAEELLPLRRQAEASERQRARAPPPPAPRARR